MYTLNHSVLVSVHCILFTVHYTLFSVHCTLFTVLCTLFTVLCTLFTVLCTLSVYCVQLIFTASSASFTVQPLKTLLHLSTALNPPQPWAVPPQMGLLLD